MSRITEANYADEALLTMKSRPPNEDGTIGVTIRPDMPEWNVWQSYFLGKRMDGRASFMRTRGKSGYMVPCRNPADFDPDIAEVRQEYSFRMHRGEIPQPDRSRNWNEIPEHERAQMAETLKELGKRIAAKNKEAFSKPKYATSDARDYIPQKVVEPRPLTEAEAASMKRLLGIKEDEQ